MFKTPEFWVLAAFVVFFVLMGKKLVVMIGGALDERAAGIRKQLDEAEKLKNDAEKALAEYRKRQQDALKEAEAIAAQARTEAQALEVEQKAQLEQRLKPARRRRSTRSPRPKPRRWPRSVMPRSTWRSPPPAAC